MSPQPFFPGDRVVCIRSSATVFGTVAFPGVDAIVGEQYTVLDCIACLDIMNVNRWGVDLCELPVDPYHSYAAERFRKLDYDAQVQERELAHAD